jgi:quercetin dioxygenase-like cupin family protein
VTLEVRRIVTRHNEFGMGIVVFRREAQCCLARSGCKHLGLRDLVHEFHASRQLDGSGNFATSRLCQEIQLCWQRPGYHCADRRVDSWTRHVLAPHGDLGLLMVLSGEIDVEFDSGQVVTMKQGDIIVMRGVTHCWKNKSTAPAVTAFILIDAVPFEAVGEKRGVLFPA